MKKQHHCPDCHAYITDLERESVNHAAKMDAYYNGSRYRSNWLQTLRWRFPHKVESELAEEMPKSMTAEMKKEIHELGTILTSLLDASERQRASEIHFTYLLVDDFNAFALRTPAGHSLCILNSLLPQSITMLNAAIVDYTVETSYTKASSLLREDNLVFTNIILELAGRPVNRSHVSMFEEKLWEDPAKAFFWQETTGAQIAFLLAHEIAHHALGHTSNTTQQELFAGIRQVMCYNRSQCEEMEADRLGIDLFCRFMRSYAKRFGGPTKWNFPTFTMLAPILLMVYFEVLENVVHGFVGKRPAQIASHPPSLDRRCLIFDTLRPFLSDDDVNQLRGVDFFLFTNLPKAAGFPGGRLIERKIVEEQ